MKWTWEVGTWKKSTKLLLLLATVWPIFYMAVFMVVVITAVTTAERHRNPCGQIDVLELDKKIRDGEIKKLAFTSGSIVATDRKEGCAYEVLVRSDLSRMEILRDAREIVNGRPRVEQIDENAREEVDLPPPLGVLVGVGFMLLFFVHMLTVLLATAAMPFYIVLAVKNDHLEQTPKIVWVILLALFTILAGPVYWYLHIWRRPKDSAPSTEGPTNADPPLTI